MTHSIDKEQKVSILLAALDERYKSMHMIRERVQSTGVWALGLLVAAGGALLQSGVVLPSEQVLLYVIGTLIAFGILRFRYLEDLQKGFKSQQRVTVRLEQSLGLFTPGVFDDDSKSVYPEDWKRAGNGEGGGKFFETTYLLLYVGVAFLLASIVLSGCY